MSVMTRRLSVVELSQSILDMARTGVYRESVFEALGPMATQKQIRQAIAHAKRFGLHSVATLRDPQLGTYYQLDLVKYERSQHDLHSLALLGSDADLTQRVKRTIQAMDHMLAIAQRVTVLLAIAGFVALVGGQSTLSLGCFSAALSALAVWLLQRAQTPAGD